MDGSRFILILACLFASACIVLPDEVTLNQGDNTNHLIIDNNTDGNGNHNSSLGDDENEKSAYQFISTRGALSPRLDESSTFTGDEVLFFGGWLPDGTQVPGLSSGAAYNILKDTWRNISSAPEGRVQHTAVWTGSQMLIWGGKPSSYGPQYSQGVLIYDKLSDSWETVNAPGELAPRYMHSAVWTGSEMIIWGGMSWWFGYTFYSDGARFNPVTRSWTPMSSTNAPSTRYQHMAFWTGNEMIILGGFSGNNQVLSSTAKAYDPKTDTWRDYDVSGFSPRASRGSTIVGWSDSKLQVWSGFTVGQLDYGLIFNPETGTAIDRLLKDSHIPTGTTGVWISDSQGLIWGVHQLPENPAAAQDGIIFSFP